MNTYTLLHSWTTYTISTFPCRYTCDRVAMAPAAKAVTVSLQELKDGMILMIMNC